MFRILRLLSLFALLAATVGANAQTSSSRLFSLSGKVIDSETGEPVALATVVLNSTIGVMADYEGHFTIDKLRRGEYTLSVSMLGYSPLTRTLRLDGDVKGLNLKLAPLSLGLDEVVVTAQSTGTGSTSKIGEEAIKHIQPMSIGDMFQLLPGSLSANPSLSSAGQAAIREISTNSNNSLGAAVIVNGAPLSNDGNMQSLSTSVAGSSSSQSLNGMADQTTAGRGVDLRSISADAVESMEVIRGIPSAEYGNLTSGVVIVKTKAGATPFEAKFKADPYSKMVYAGKGFGLSGGGALNVGVDYTQSFADPRKRYLGYDRITATASYARGNYVLGRLLNYRIGGTFYTNINNSKSDPQMAVTSDRYKNKNTGARLNLEGNWALNSALLTALDFTFMASQSKQVDILHEYVASAPGAVTNALTAGTAQATQLNASYYADYKIEGKPLSLYAQLKANRLIQISEGTFTNIRFGVDWQYDANSGRGVVYDIALPPQNSSSAALRPRSFKDVPALNNLAGFVEDKLQLQLGPTNLNLQAGVRFSNMFVDHSWARRGDIFVSEPRVNAVYTLFDTAKGSLALTGGWGLSYKNPTLLYLYPDRAYFDRIALNRVSESTAGGSMALMTTAVVESTANPDLKPARSNKFEGGVRWRLGKIQGTATYFEEKHTNEFGFSSRPYYMTYGLYSLPQGAAASQLQFADGTLTYLNAAGERVTATATPTNYIGTYYVPTNRMRTDKRGVEYTLDLGTYRPLRTGLIIDGAWFRIRRIDDSPTYSKISESYDYIRLMPSGSGTLQDRVNTNFRFVTHIPKLKLVFSTTMQVVWYESQQNIWEDASGRSLVGLSTDGKQSAVSPLGFYDAVGNYTEWQESFASDSRYSVMVSKSLINAYDRETFNPWVMFNFRLTKEIGRIGELSFTANNFTRTSRYHYYDTKSGYKQIYPDIYFGAELKIKL